MSGPPDLDALVRAHAAGDRAAVTRLFPAFYDELRRLAHRQLARDAPRGARTLSTTALVHEAFLKLGHTDGPAVENRRHFFALVAQAMRQIIIDDARRHMTGKRGGGALRLSFDEQEVAVEREADRLLALDQALARLDALDPRLGRVVECRFFAGLTEEETAEVLGVTARTVRRDWTKAKGWLHRTLE
jgi:RNA polymerase sigma factor (TIGR02999 family)